ncbi:MAG: hypothetical protein ACE5HX_00115 [bacterium]
MKKKQKEQKKDLIEKKKTYEKPRIIHSSKIETLAGSCASTVSCTPNVS